eukprot:g30940.t1
MQVAGCRDWSMGKVEQIGEKEDGQVVSVQGGGEILKLVNFMLRPLGCFQFPDLPLLIFTMGIQSLYTCHPQADGLKALRFFLSHRPNQSPFTHSLIHSAELVLTLNKFSFNSSHSLQTKGLAMGSHMGPNYACLFVGYAEQSLLRSYTGTIPHLFLCYIDDCIDAASCSHEELEQVIHFTNTFHPDLKFTWTSSNTSLSFLDLSVSIS